MFKKTAIFSLILCFNVSGALIAQHSHDHNHTHHHQPREINFPDIPGYHTISTDLHIHTVFSDGSVWPDIRVEEALKDSIDAIAITEHLEYQPHSEDIPHPDRNRSHEIASEQAGDEDLIIINGSEITRSMPPGHSNAIFLDDANALLTDDAKDAFREAGEQGAFTFWNHPFWLSQASDGLPPLSDMHKELIEEDLLHGIEVVNMDRYSKESLQIALDYDLTIMGTSDVHGLIDWDYEVQHDGHRPVTLVFAEEHSEEGLKEGLFEGRTVVWKDELLIGREQWLVPLIEESIKVESASYIGDSSVLELEIVNHTGQKFILENLSDYSFHRNSDLLTVDPYHTLTVEVRTVERLQEVKLPVKVRNAITAPDTHPDITFEIAVE